MYKLEEYESILRSSAAENATVKIFFTANPLDPEKAQKLKAAHEKLLQSDEDYPTIFASYKKNYLKHNDLMTRGEDSITDFNPDASTHDRWKGIALIAFHMAVLAIRLPEAAIAGAQEDKAARKMFEIYVASAPAP